MASASTTTATEIDCSTGDIWATTGNRAPFHDEGIGKGNVPKLVKFQLRPDPLAK